MIDELVQWQVRDPKTGCVFPWFTHPFLEVLRAWDLKDKYVLEYGGGRSTAWWRKKSKHVTTIETNIAFVTSIMEECEEKSLLNGDLHLRLINEGDQTRINDYVQAWKCQDEWYHYDVVVVDGILRYESMIEGIAILSDRGGKLIVDNWQQDGFVCPACAELVKDYEGHIYRQEDHTDHNGNPWQTAYWEISKI
jgi:hypothetical protein